MRINRIQLVAAVLLAFGHFQANAAIDDKQIIVMLNSGYKSAEIQSLIRANGYVGRRDPDTLMVLKQNGATLELLDLLSYNLKYPFPLITADVRALLLNKSPINLIIQELETKGFEGRLSSSEALGLVTYGATPELIKKIQRTGEQNLAMSDDTFLLMGQKPRLENGILVFGRAGYGTEGSRMLIRPEWEEAGAFKSGLARVQVGGKFGYIDKTGSMAIAPHFSQARDFSEGRAVVTLEGTDEAAYRYITTDGTLLSNDAWESAGDFKEGLARVALGGHYGFINPDGKLVIPLQWPATGEFHEGMAWVKSVTDSGKEVFGFIDRKGSMVVPATFDEVHEFSEGMAAFRKGDAWGFMNSTGKVVIEPKYRQAHSFSEAVAAVKVDYFSLDKWVYINPAGQKAITGTWLDAGDFHKGVAEVSDSNGGLIINRDGGALLTGEWKLAQNQPAGNLILVTRTLPGKPLQAAYTDLSGRIIWRSE